MTATDTGQSALPLARKMLDSRCASQHFGAWCVETKWFQAALASVRAGTLKPEPVAYDDDEDGSTDALYEVNDGIAIIAIDGQMTKRGSSFGGCSTVEVRQALRQAAVDWMVKGIVLHICSPGGTVAGTADLADDVLSVREGRIGPGKPVVAYIADMGCSAAYWVASQTERIYANKTAIVGSIGTYTVLEDDTKWQEDMGVKWRVVSTGPFKGLGADGAVSDALVADVQREVNELNAPFLAAVSAGRGSIIPDIAAVSDGRAYVSEQAKSLGLVDEVASFDAAILALSKRINPMTPTEQVKQIAADHPESVASFRDEGRKAGHSDGRKETLGELKANVEAAKNDYELAVKATLAGHDPEAVRLAIEAREKADAAKAAADQAHAAALAEKDKEIARLKFEQEGRGPIGTAGAQTEQPKIVASLPTDRAPTLDEAKAAAGAEYDANPTVIGKGFSSKDRYVSYRAAELMGQVRTLQRA